MWGIEMCCSVSLADSRAAALFAKRPKIACQIWAKHFKTHTKIAWSNSALKIHS
jgi:hypothetical protein